MKQIKLYIMVDELGFMDSFTFAYSKMEAARYFYKKNKPDERILKQMLGDISEHTIELNKIYDPWKGFDASISLADGLILRPKERRKI